MNLEGTIEQALTALARDGYGLYICKANDGFSAVLISRDLYSGIVVRKHYNGKTIESAIRKAVGWETEE
jgi:hypothetical protein